jgi:hypothetical protein
MSYTTRIASGKVELKDFFQFPYRVYNGDQNWVAPMLSECKRVLDRNKNPYFHNVDLQLFNCYKDGEIHARSCIVINKGYDTLFGKRTALFGFFESMNDQRAVTNLFETIHKYCTEQEVEQIIGPFNPNHYSEMGLRMSGFDSAPVFFQSYNPPYYYDLLTGSGFELHCQIHTRRRENSGRYLNTSYREREFVLPPGYSFRTFNSKNKAQELEVLREIYNDAFEDNAFFLPLTKEEYIFSAKYLGLVSDPEMIVFAEYNGQPVGVVQFCYDINPALKKLNGKSSLLKYPKFLLDRKKCDTVIVFAIAVKKSHRNSKVMQMLIVGSMSTLNKFKAVETTWMSYDNPLSIRTASRRGFSPDKEFAILCKSI